MSREAGTVKFFNDVKGFGFILPDVTGAEVFVHKSDLERGTFTLKQHQRVSYEVALSDKGNGRKAVHVRLEDR